MLVGRTSEKGGEDHEIPTRGRQQGSGPQGSQGSTPRRVTVKEFHLRTPTHYEEGRQRRCLSGRAQSALMHLHLQQGQQVNNPPNTPRELIPPSTAAREHVCLHCPSPAGAGCSPCRQAQHQGGPGASTARQHHPACICQPRTSSGGSFYCKHLVLGLA